MKVKSLSRVRLLATPWTAAYQAPPSIGFSRQECWSGVPLPSPIQMLVYHKYWQKLQHEAETNWFTQKGGKLAHKIPSINHEKLELDSMTQWFDLMKYGILKNIQSETNWKVKMQPYFSVHKFKIENQE